MLTIKVPCVLLLTLVKQIVGHRLLVCGTPLYMPVYLWLVMDLVLLLHLCEHGSLEAVLLFEFHHRISCICKIVG